MKLVEVQATKEFASTFLGDPILKMAVNAVLNNAPETDAVTVKELEAWLYEIAMNNTNNTLGGACEEIIRRLDGLRQFSKDRGIGGV